MTTKQHRKPWKPKELAVLLDCDVKSVKAWAEKGDIRFIKLGATMWIPADEVDRILEGKKNEASETA